MLTDNGSLSVLCYNEKLKRFTLLQHITLYTPNDWARSHKLGHLHRIAVSNCSRSVAISIAAYQVPNTQSPSSIGSLIFTLDAKEFAQGNASDHLEVFEPVPDVYDGLDLHLHVDTQPDAYSGSLELFDVIHEKLKPPSEPSLSGYQDYLYSSELPEEQRQAKERMDALSSSVNQSLSVVGQALEQCGLFFSHPAVGLRLLKKEEEAIEDAVDLDLFGSGLGIWDREWKQCGTEMPNEMIDGNCVHWNAFVKRGRRAVEAGWGLNVLGLSFTSLTPSTPGSIPELSLLALTQR